MCSCHSILECCVTFSGVKLSLRLFVLLLLLVNFISAQDFEYIFLNHIPLIMISSILSLPKLQGEEK